MKTGRSLSIVFSAFLIVACGTTNTQLVPNGGSVFPNALFQLTPNIAYTSEKIGLAGVAGGLLYMIYDPLAPNWSIKETVVNEETYYLSLRAKSFRTGGDGEAVQILKRRALHLQREKGYAGYRILDYSEGVESSTPLTHRFSEGTIQLVKTVQPTTVR